METRQSITQNTLKFLVEKILLFQSFTVLQKNNSLCRSIGLISSDVSYFKVTFFYSVILIFSYLLVSYSTYSIRLTANPRVQIDSGDPVLSFGYLTILLASIVIEIIATF